MRRPKRRWQSSRALKALHRRSGTRTRGRRGRGLGAVVEAVREDLDMDEREIGMLERVKEIVDERQIERVAIQPEDLERARRARGEVRAQRLPRGGCEPQHGEAKLAQVRRAEVDEEGGEEGVPQLGVACEVYRADVGLVEGCCELDYDPWIGLGFP